MYKLIEFLVNMSTATDAAAVDAESQRRNPEHTLGQSATNGYTPLLAGPPPQSDGGQPEVVIKRHAKYFKRFLELLPAKLALHDSTR